MLDYLAKALSVLNESVSISLKLIGVRQREVGIAPLAPLRTLAHRLSSSIPDFRCEHWAKPISPMTNAFMAGVDVAFVG